MLLPLHLPFKVNIAKIILSRSGAAAMCNVTLLRFFVPFLRLCVGWVAGLIKNKTKLNPQLGLGWGRAWQLNKKIEICFENQN